MAELMVLAMTVAGVTGLVLMPLALMEIMRVGRLNRQLAERNSVQAQALSALDQQITIEGGMLTEEDLAALYRGGPKRMAHRAAVEAGYADLPEYVAEWSANTPKAIVRPPLEPCQSCGAAWIFGAALCGTCNLGREQAKLNSLGWVVGNGSQWRAWEDGSISWVSDRNFATRYARRIDAENVHREDEDAWVVEPF